MVVAADRATAAARDAIERFGAEPAPFLAILHAIQDRLGWLPEPALEEVGGALELPLADLFGTVSFYRYFRLSPDAKHDTLPCSGPACRLRGAPVDGISCPGQCDVDAAGFRSPPPIRTGFEVLFRDAPRYAVLRAAERGLEPLKRSGLAGRGGAGFPAGLKWEAVRQAPGRDKVVVCNADEGEPGCFKDRALLTHVPHKVLEGMILAGLVTGARAGILYLRYEYRDLLPGLERAIAEAPLDGFPILIRLGAGAYICGEETSLLNSLEGRRPFPRERPPYPTTHGLFGMPTLVHNVETLAAATEVFRGAGVSTRVFSVSGDVERPGNYELPLDTPMRRLLELAGARDVKAVTLGGISGGFSTDFDMALRDPRVGAGGVIVYGRSRCMARAAEACMRFFAAESCGKCFPCRIGTVRLHESLTSTGADPRPEMEEVDRAMTRLSACGLGVAAPSVTRSLVARWPDELLAHREGRCLAGECAA
jgi:[NiFe] hydrogenase diaphorase moiety large subunit